MTGPPTIALVPLRGDGKSRLGGSIDVSRRGALVAAMLDDVVAALTAGGVDAIRILAGDTAAAALAVARGLSAITDTSTDAGTDAGTPPTGDARLRHAVDTALATTPHDAVRLVVAADLPRLSAAEVATVLASTVDVAVVPTVGGGTALLRLAPHVVIPTRYGPGSAGAHLRTAEEQGLSTAALDLPGARHDVDVEEDLLALDGTIDGTAPGRATAAFLAGAAG